MSTKSAFRVWVAAILLLTALAISESSAIAARVCPPFGADDIDCGTIITITNIINSQGLATLESVVFHTGQPPYDRDIINGWNGDDTLVGVLNNSSKPISSIRLRSAFPIFGEDFGASPSDGICGTSFFTGLRFNTVATDCPSGPKTLFGKPYTLNGYEGPDVFFTNLTSTEGTVLFDPPIVPGGKRYFGLEADITNTLTLGSCKDAIDFSLTAFASDDITPAGLTRGVVMNAAFTPKNGTSNAAESCGFAKFNWISRMEHLPLPSPYVACNQSLPNCTMAVPVTTAHNDPPEHGDYYRKCWDSFPFYWDMRSAPSDPKCTAVDFLLINNYNETSLLFKDIPSDALLEVCSGVLPSPNPAGCYLGFNTRLVGVYNDGSYKDLGMGFTWTDSYNGSTTCTTTAGVTFPCASSANLESVIPGSGTGGITITGVQNISNYDYNGIVVTAVNGAPTGGETIPPAIMVSATPMKLWPPNKLMVPVTVSGTITDNEPGGTGVNPSTAAYVVSDEYGLVQPAGAVTLGTNGSYSFTIQLEAARKGDDKDGRQYLITVSAEDYAGLKGSSSTHVSVPHNQQHDRKHHRKHHREDDRDHHRKHDRDHDQSDDQDHDERDDRRH